MNKNWLSGILATLCMVATPWVGALGLGDITTESALNEPLIAEISLINVGDLDESDLVVAIGTPSDYELAGVTREFFHTSIKFDVETDNSGNPKILVRSDGPLTEPYVNFLVQLRWPQGKLLREYTLLLDLPVFSRQQASAPRAATQSSSVRASSNIRGLSARDAAEQHDARTSRGETRPTQRAVTRVSSGSRNSVSSDIRPESQYKVASGDTLWDLAGAVVANSGLSRYQAMVSIHEKNPRAFDKGDVNRLQAGSNINMPSNTQMQERTSNEAFRQFSNISSTATATPLSGVDGGFRGDSGSNTAGPSGRLTLSSPEDVGSAGGSIDSDDLAEKNEIQASLDSSTAENAALKEELDAAEVVNEELSQRIKNLEEQLEISRDLLEEQDTGVGSAALAEAQATQEAREELEASQAEEPVRAAPPQPLTLMEKIRGFLPWILAGVGSLIVIGLIVFFMIFKRRKNADDLSDMEAEYLEGDALIPGGDELDDELNEGELDEDELNEDEQSEDEDVFDEDDLNIEDELNIEDASDDELPSELQEALQSEKVDEFEDFATEFPGIGGEEQLDGENEEDEQEVDLSEETDSSDFGDLEELFTEDESDLDTGLTFTAPDAPLSSDEDGESSDDEPSIEEPSVEFELSKESAQSAADSGLDFGSDFGYKGPESFDDLSESAVADFDDSLEIHTPEIDQLLVPTDDDGLDDDTDDLLAEVDESREETEGFDEGLDDGFQLGEQEEDSELGDLGTVDEVEFELPIEEDELDDPSVDLQNEGLAEELQEEVVEVDLDDPSLADEQDAEEGSVEVETDEKSDQFNLDEGMDGGLDGLNESGIFDDDDEEFVTKLELAEAYLDIGDVQGARELLAEVQKDGNDVQQAAATSMLEEIESKNKS